MLSLYAMLCEQITCSRSILWLRNEKHRQQSKLGRQPHRAAMERLQRAYQLLIEANQNTEIIDVEPEDENTSQEVLSRNKLLLYFA